MSFSNVLTRWGVLLLMLVTLSGCLFIRLSRVLVQMKDPYRYLEVDLEAETFHATLIEPVVYLKDIEKIVGLEPVATGGRWLFKFEKLGVSDREPWSVFVSTTKKNKVQSFELPPRVTSILGNPWVMSGIRAVGRAEVSIRERRVYLEVDETLKVTQILELLGKPSEKEEKSWVYQFGSEEQPLIVDVELQGEAVSSLLMSSGKLSASFTFQLKGTDSVE